jgi:Flp pilus assembly protein CpaB
MFKSKKSQNILIGILALSMGASTFLYLASLGTQARDGSEEIAVYVANTEIPAGTTFQSMLQNSSITVKKIPAAVAGGTAVRNPSEFTENEGSRSAIDSGQLILRNMFAPAKDLASGLNIPKGSLAISISVDDVSRVANFVVPGSRVVIFSTGADSKKGDSITRVLVSNALVLAIGSQVSAPPGGVQVTTSPLVTLAVNPFEAEQIIHASQSTKLSFALAHANEPKSISLPSSGISTASLFREG